MSMVDGKSKTEKRREYFRQWLEKKRIEDPEFDEKRKKKALEATRRWQEKHPEFKEKLKQRRVSDPEYVKRQREWSREYARKWRAKNPYYYPKKYAEWKAEHPDEVKADRRSRYEEECAAIIARRIPCACGCGEFLTTPRYKGKYAGVGHERRGKEWVTAIRASKFPTIIEIGWIVGFLEGEGSFLKVKGSNSQLVCATQVQREPLERLQSYLGGRIKYRVREDSRKHFRNVQPSHEWTIFGSRARGVMMTVYSLMSPKRQEQIKKALGNGKW